MPLPPSTLQNTLAVVDQYDSEANIARYSRTALMLIGGLFAAFVVGMVLIPIQGAVIASGQVGAESRVKHIAHPVGGIVAGIFVRNGDHVTKGEPLVQLDNNVSQAARSFASLTVDQLKAQRARLDAERLGRASIEFPPELLNSKDPGAQEAMEQQRRLFISRRSDQTQQRAQLNARVDQYQEQVSGYEAQITALKRQQALIEPELKGVQDLWTKGLVTISRLNQLERTAADMDGSIASLGAQIAEARAHETEIREQIIQLDETRRSDSATQLDTVNSTLNDQQVRNVTAGDQLDQSLIRAPYEGTVDKLTITAIGDVVKPADPIMDIVPDKDPMVVEAAVQPTDVDQVKVGQPVRIKFSGLNSTAIPDFNGKVIYVAAARSSNPDTKQAFYEVRAQIDAEGLKDYPSVILKSGLPAQLYIQTGYRSMISYITKPLRDQISRAFRDN